MGFLKRDISAAAVGALAAVVLLGVAGQLILRSDGIEFSDDTLQTTAAPEVVDSLGRTMGSLLGVEGTSRLRADTYLSLGDPERKVFFTLSYDTYYLLPLNGYGYVYFTGPGCTGAAYLTSGRQVDGALYAFAGPGVLYTSDESSPENITPQSRWQDPGDWSVGNLSDKCHTEAYPSRDAYLGEFLADLKTLPYVPPFEIR